MTPQVLDIETICPKCDYEFTVTYVSHESEAAEAHAAELEKQLVGAAQVVVTLTGERDAQRRMIAQIRELVDAYPEHDVVEAVRRFAGRLRDAEAQRDEARRQLDGIQRELSEAFNSGDGVYRP